MSLTWERDFTTEAEQGDDLAAALHSHNQPNQEWMANLRFYCMEAGYDQKVGCAHTRGAFNDSVVAAHAERGIEIPRSFFCFDCGDLQEFAKGTVHPPAPENNSRTISVKSGDVLIISGDRSFLANLDPNRVDYVTPDGTEVWIERKGNKQQVRFLDAYGNQVGPTHKNLVPAIVWAAMNDWRDPSSPDWWNDETIAQTKASARGEVGAWEGGWVDRTEAHTK